MAMPRSAATATPDPPMSTTTAANSPAGRFQRLCRRAVRSPTGTRRGLRSQHAQRKSGQLNIPSTGVPARRTHQSPATGGPRPGRRRAQCSRAIRPSCCAAPTTFHCAVTPAITPGHQVETGQLQPKRRHKPPPSCQPKRCREVLMGPFRTQLRRTSAIRRQMGKKATGSGPELAGQNPRPTVVAIRCVAARELGPARLQGAVDPQNAAELRAAVNDAGLRYIDDH